MRIKMPAVRIAQADSDTGQTHQDILTCGVCQKHFLLGDINKFIQHKVHACNKENYSLENNVQGDNEDDGPCGGLPLAVVNSRRPSISAPIKKGMVNQGRIICSSPLNIDDETRCSTPKPRTPVSSGSPTPIKNESEIDHRTNGTDDEEIRHSGLKRELDSTGSSFGIVSSKKSKTELVDAESNTTHTEPSHYICSSCKLRLHSAWRLLQHVQNDHGLKIYLESPSSSGSSPTAPNPVPMKNSKNHSSSSASSGSSGFSASSSGCFAGIPSSLSSTSLPLPPTGMSSRLSMIPPSSSMIEPHNPFGVNGLLRMPDARHFPNPAALTPPVFPRPSSHQDSLYRMEQLATEQFRLNQHHNLGLAAAVAAASGMVHPHPSYTPNNDRNTSGNPHINPRPMLHAPPSLSLSLEPSLDFYSQRLRQLAGNTSPGVANNICLSPNKMTPPFTSPGNSQAPQRCIPSSSPRIPNNNNNTSLLNNNSCSQSSDHTSSGREQSLTPPTKRDVQDEKYAAETIDLSVTPKLTTTPGSSDDKPEDFSKNKNSSVSEGEEKVNECEFCGKKFRSEGSLLVHRRTHTGEKPYKCTVCNHTCAQSSKLRRHMKIHRRSNKANSQATSEEYSDSINVTDHASNEGSIDESDDDESVDDDEEEVEEELEEEEVEEEEEEEMELDDEEDEDDVGGDAPEDLTTKSTSSTPPNGGEESVKSSLRPTPSQTPVEKLAPGSLVGELMDKFGLNNIQQYSEAYKQALQENNAHIKRRDDPFVPSAMISDNNNGIGKPTTPITENGICMKSALRVREEFAKNMMSGQPPLDLIGNPHGLFPPGVPFENILDVASKRMKMDIESRHNPLMNRSNETPDAMYPNMWLPAMAAAHHRDMFAGRADVPFEMLRGRKSNSENRHKISHNSSLAAAAAAMNLLPAQHLKKESKRNDTCEYCGKVFKNCSNLTVHRRSHTGEKPYKCELCSYACAQSSKLTRHMKTHGRMGKDVYRCRFCEMPFSVPSTLEKHMRKCVVNQNIKNEGNHLMHSMMRCDDDSSISSTKDNT